MTEPVIVVSGFPRCGSSLVMQMLRAGGMSCVGNPPAFEDRRTAEPPDPEWFASLGGRAVKLLDPHRNIPPAGVEARFIWLDRDPIEQAKSQIKFIRVLQGLQVCRGAASRVARSLIEDRPAAMRAMGGRWQLRMSFEDLIQDPMGAAIAIAEFMHSAFPGNRRLDVISMVGIVLRRSPRCMPDLAIEAAAVAREEGRRLA